MTSSKLPQTRGWEAEGRAVAPPRSPHMTQIQGPPRPNPPNTETAESASCPGRIWKTGFRDSLNEAPFRLVQSKGALRKGIKSGLIWKPRFLGNTGLREAKACPGAQGALGSRAVGVQGSGLSRENGRGWLLRVSVTRSLQAGQGLLFLSRRAAKSDMTRQSSPTLPPRV